MIIAIDGPAGAGKSTIARSVARALGYAYIDTGAMYRSVALAAVEQAIDPEMQPEAVASLAATLPIRFGAGGTQVFVGARDVSALIRTLQVGSMASRVAALAPVRAHAVERQRALARQAEAELGGAVLEGRDIQTVVFPEADVKIFLTASARTRAQRRLSQWQNDGIFGEELDLKNAERDVGERDARDASRAASPLQAAPDATHIASDDYSAQEIVERVVALARAAA